MKSEAAVVLKASSFFQGAFFFFLICPHKHTICCTQMHHPYVHHESHEKKKKKKNCPQCLTNHESPVTGPSKCRRKKKKRTEVTECDRRRRVRAVSLSKSVCSRPNDTKMLGRAFSVTAFSEHRLTTFRPRTLKHELFLLPRPIDVVRGWREATVFLLTLFGASTARVGAAAYTSGGTVAVLALDAASAAGVARL